MYVMTVFVFFTVSVVILTVELDVFSRHPGMFYHLAKSSDVFDVLTI